MLIFIIIASIIYIWDLVYLIKARRIRDIIILSVFTVVTFVFGVFYLSNPQRNSFIYMLFHVFNIEY